MHTIETIADPTQFPLYNVKDKTVVVIDILRATSTMVSALHHGISSIVALESVDEAFELKKSNPEFLLAGERSGVQVEGFDLGNSPRAFLNGVSAEHLIMTTTNGTKCIKLSEEGRNVVIGSFLNLTATVDYVNELNNDVVLFCAGWKGLFNMEDFLFAGAVVSQLKRFGNYTIKDDATLVADRLYTQNKQHLVSILEDASHPQRFKKLGFTEDLPFCLQLDLYPLVAVYDTGRVGKV